MHRVSERVFQAKADLERCTEEILELEAAARLFEGCLMLRTAKEVREELEYWKLRAESAKGMLEAEGVQASE